MVLMCPLMVPVTSDLGSLVQVGDGHSASALASDRQILASSRASGHSDVERLAVVWYTVAGEVGQNVLTPNADGKYEINVTAEKAITVSASMEIVPVVA